MADLKDSLNAQANALKQFEAASAIPLPPILSGALGMFATFAPAGLALPAFPMPAGLALPAFPSPAGLFGQFVTPSGVTSRPAVSQGGVRTTVI